MKRYLIVLYGTGIYVLFLGVLSVLVLFLQNLVLPRTIDSGGSETPLGTALAIDLGLIALFGLQHNVMARQSFKRRWTKIVHPAIERATYVLATLAVLGLFLWQWRPIPTTVWSVSGPAAYVLMAISWLGWGQVLLVTFLIDHFDLFGLKQVLQHFRGKPHREPSFCVVALYRKVRHPLYLGFLIAFWSAPEMTVGRLLFAVVTTAWVFFSIKLEERDLVAVHGDPYREYRARVPMILPVPRRMRPRVPAPAPESASRSR